MIQFLDNLLIRPLMPICGEIFEALVGFTESTALALILLGIVVNLLLLPVYFQMERSGREERNRRQQMDREIARIAPHFQGRERYYYVRTVHRHYGHRPLRALFAAKELFLQMLVFMTVYRYLSHSHAVAEGSLLGIIRLSHPDGLLEGINLLPLLMTAINLASVVFYVEDPSEHRQGFLLATLFLVLLYSSGSGLVLYWIASNVFSLLRNILARHFSVPEPLRLSFERFRHQV